MPFLNPTLADLIIALVLIVMFLPLFIKRAPQVPEMGKAEKIADTIAVWVLSISFGYFLGAILFGIFVK